MTESNKVTKARKAFESLKSQGLQVTRAAVARLSGGSRSLLSIDRRTGKYKSKEWECLACDISVYEATQKPENILEKYRNKYDDLRSARDAMEHKYHAQLQQNAELIGTVVEAKAEIADLRSAYDQIVYESEQAKRRTQSLSNHSAPAATASNVKVVPISKPYFISTDNHLLKVTGGEYKWDSLSLIKAHTFARKELECVLQRPVQKRLFITIGRPASGKSDWIEYHKRPLDRLNIYFDATNATRADRWEIVQLAKAASNILVCFVYFDTGVSDCVRNNQNRPNKGISDNIIMNYTVELPEVDEEFDELLVVREQLPREIIKSQAQIVKMIPVKEN